jgi:hypothetical protein
MSGGPPPDTSSQAAPVCEARKEAMRKCQVSVETLLAENKLWHGGRRNRLRGRVNVTIVSPFSG